MLLRKVLNTIPSSVSDNNDRRMDLREIMVFYEKYKIFALQIAPVLLIMNC
jgi:hypothetical protein